MTINLQTGASYTPPQALPGARSADIQVGQKQQVYQDAGFPAPPTSAQSAPDAGAVAEQRRYEQVATASKSLARDFYPVSDKTFTIFKDASGVYITRYMSLRDGRVTYVPEPKLLQMFESQYNRSSVVAIQA